MSCAGLSPVMALAEQAGIGCVANRFTSQPRGSSRGRPDPAGNWPPLIAGMCAGADVHRRCRPGPRRRHETPSVHRVYARVNGGNCCCEECRTVQVMPASVAIRGWPSIWPACVIRVNLLPGGAGSGSSTSIRGAPPRSTRHAKQGASLRAHQNCRQAGLTQRTLPRWSPTISTDTAPPAGHRDPATRRENRTPVSGAARMVAQAIDHRPRGRGDPRVAHRARSTAPTVARAVVPVPAGDMVRCSRWC